ncbi:hypothetical protein V6N11_031150 [Hibiscus sabdariffa]|uniref:Uncharacterized protein n=2 Tax=Hibiscus sabdariffa TaxID=183260 RepID=A0ABR2NA82_9ROSI
MNIMWPPSLLWHADHSAIDRYKVHQQGFGWFNRQIIDVSLLVLFPNNFFGQGFPTLDACVRVPGYLVCQGFRSLDASPSWASVRALDGLMHRPITEVFLCIPLPLWLQFSGLIHMFAESCGLKRVLLCAHACHGATIWPFWPHFSVECTEFAPHQGLIPPRVVEQKGLCWCAQNALYVALASWHVTARCELPTLWWPIVRVALRFSHRCVRFDGLLCLPMRVAWLAPGARPCGLESTEACLVCVYLAHSWLPRHITWQASLLVWAGLWMPHYLARKLPSCFTLLLSQGLFT